jgi:DNA-binding transcriptional LysR family regulator
MDRLHEIEVFIAVAEAGSFSKAAVRLRRSPPSVTRAISALEERLGARVFNRTTRSLAITEVGQRYLEGARRVVAELETAEREAAGDGAVPHGHLTITASVTFGRSVLAPVLGAFLDRHPRITLSARLLDRVVNLVEEGVDLAVRIGHLPDSTLIARRIGSVRRILIASPDYLARCGAPETPADLAHHTMIAFTGLMPRNEWRYVDGNKPTTVALNPRFEINDAAAAIQAAELGRGVTVALSYMVSEQFRGGALVPLLDAYTPPPQPVHLVYPHARLIAPKIRAFIDFAAPRLQEALAGLA